MWRLFQTLLSFVFFAVFLYGQMPLAEGAIAESPWVFGKAKHSRVRLISEKQALDRNASQVILGIEFEFAPGWHGYWKEPGGVGFAPRLKWSLPPQWSASPLLYPAPKRIVVTQDKTRAEIYGYEKKILMPVVLYGNLGDLKYFEAKLDLDYLVCEVQCIPERAELRLRIPVSRTKESSHFARLQKTLDLIPKPVESLRIDWVNDRELVVDFRDLKVEDIFFSEAEHPLKASGGTKNQWRITADTTILPFELTATFSNAAGLRTGLTSKVTDNPFKDRAPSLSSLWLVLLFAFIGGALLNLMPCVLPVVVLKTFSLLKMSQKKKAVRLSAFQTILGILVSFLVLAIVTLMIQSLGAEIGWGFQFQSPWFVGVLTAILLIFAFNLFGFFEIQLPARLSTRLGFFRGPFFEGVFATILATPCTAPFLGTAVAYALSQSALALTFIFLVMGCGLALPYAIFIVWPQAVRLFPKPGAWMNHLRILLALSLLFAAGWLGTVYFRQTTDWLPTQIDENILPFSEVALDDLRKEGKTIFVNITADWCLTCKFNEATVLHTNWFQESLEEKGVVFMQADWTRPDESIAAFLQKYGRAGIPFSMITNARKSNVLPELLTRPMVEKALSEF